MSNTKILFPEPEYFVPEREEQRAQLIHYAQQFCLQNKLVAPFDYGMLYTSAGELLTKFQLEEKYRAFAMVCLGNQLWRPVVQSVPFHRRILLLPECLKNSRNCKAEKDILGLLCSGCGNCDVASILDYAEELGYVCLVTEGTTTTSQLIMQGKIDAVVGVGCLESLQKIFTLVQQHAVPSIGIPLLNDGCSDTLVDEQWLIRELPLFTPDNNLKLLPAAEIKDWLQSLFTSDTISRLLNANKNQETALAVTSILNGGQRTRPFLSVLAYKAFCATPNKKTEENLALAMECFHKSSLIHDDIEDNDDLRYGKPTLHASAGVATAINTGDLLLGEGYRLISECPESPVLLLKAINYISICHREMALGQGAELRSAAQGTILSPEEMLELFHQKTAMAFNAALIPGAIIAGAGQEQVLLLERFGILFGKAYQLMDDIQDYRGESSDITQRRFSFLLSLLYHALSKEKQWIINQAIANTNFNLIFKLIEENRTIEKAEGILAELLLEIRASLDIIEPAGLKYALYALFGKTFKPYL